MPRHVARKWRPTLATVVSFTIAMVLWIPLIGILSLGQLQAVIGWTNATTIVTILIVVMAGYVGWVLWRILLRPIVKLAARANAFKAGEPGALDPLSHYGTSEMAALGQAILDMGRVLQGREKVIRSYADHVTHELKSPLTVVRGAAELLEVSDLGPADRARLIGNIRGAVERMESLLDSQRALARADEPLPEGACRMSEVLKGVNNTSLLHDGEVPLPAETVSLVVGHLVSNAVAHGATMVTFEVLTDALLVSDDGHGISEGNRDRIFDPFFTTRRATGGTGMGLPIVRRMLAAQGAEIELTGDSGATFEIRY